VSLTSSLMLRAPVFCRKLLMWLRTVHIATAHVSQICWVDWPSISACSTAASAAVIPVSRANKSMVSDSQARARPNNSMTVLEPCPSVLEASGTAATLNGPAADESLTMARWPPAALQMAWRSSRSWARSVARTTPADAVTYRLCLSSRSAARLA
jgi:hypothetical protein